MTTLGQVLKITLGAALLIPVAALPGKADGPPPNFSEHGRTLDHWTLVITGTTKLDLRPTALLPDVHGNVVSRSMHRQVQLRHGHHGPESCTGSRNR
jgi:hypothetical protein